MPIDRRYVQIVFPGCYRCIIAAIRLRRVRERGRERKKRERERERERESVIEVNEYKRAYGSHSM